MLLEVQNGTFYYQKDTPLLRDVNFTLDSGEIMAVMGRNGIGKTTLIKCIAGILNWKSGGSVVAGEKSGPGKPSRVIGYVPQAHKASFSYPVRDMVVFGRTGRNSYFAAPQKDDYLLAGRLLERLGISDLADKRCNELSGGQLQMVFIARALINNPRLLILDEPEAHLDFRNQLRLLKLLENIVSEQNIACIINTHYPNHAVRIAGKCFLLGEHTYEVGLTQEIMNEENIRNYFSVYARPLRTTYRDKEISTFVFLDEA